MNEPEDPYKQFLKKHPRVYLGLWGQAKTTRRLNLLIEYNLISKHTIASIHTIVSIDKAIDNSSLQYRDSFVYWKPRYLQLNFDYDYSSGHYASEFTDELALELSLLLALS